MRMTLSISAALVALWLAYAVSPFVGVYRLVGAIEQRDVAALSARVDFPAVRGSLAGQVARMYLKITGKAGEPGKLIDQLSQQLAAGVAASIADQVVADLVSPHGLLDLLRTGGPRGIASEGLPTPGGLSFEALGNVWRPTSIRNWASPASSSMCRSTSRGRRASGCNSACAIGPGSFAASSCRSRCRFVWRRNW
jgi:Protein of unknown function (DUF2939)